MRGRRPCRPPHRGRSKVSPGSSPTTRHSDVVGAIESSAGQRLAEYAACGSITTTGVLYHQSIIAVFRVSDGKIVSYRDYLNPLALIEAVISTLVL
jgi:ketosteroid isomerase-like protein